MKDITATCLFLILLVTAAAKALYTPVIVVGLITHILEKPLLGFSGMSLVLIGIGMFLYIQAVLCFEPEIDKLVNNTTK